MPVDRVQMLFRTRHVYRQVFATPEGRAVLADLFRFCHVGSELMVPGDPQATGFNLGMRRVALRIAKFVNMTDAEVMRFANQTNEVLDEHD